MDRFLVKSSSSSPFTSKPKLINSKKRPREETNKSSGLTQTYLDLGQKFFNGKECKKCGMYFSVGIDSEDRSHAKHCNSIIEPLEFKGWKTEVVSWASDSHNGGRIISIDVALAPAAHLKKLSQLKEQVDLEMGFYNGMESKNRRVAYLYIQNQAIVAMVVVEAIKEAFPLIIKDVLTDTSNVDPSDQLLCREKEPKIALLGVSQIWTHFSKRRLGLASKLLDVARSKFIYGFTIPIDQVAFTHPTPNGNSFASKYTGKKSFLVYS